MKNYIILFFCIFVVAVGVLKLYMQNSSSLFWNDVNYLWEIILNQHWEDYIDQNKLPSPAETDRSLCFVTLETRGDREEYVRLHNRNIQEYVDYQNKKSGKKRYDYRFLTSCQSNINHPHNVYWCKFFCLQNILELNQYDYVVFLDSDTVIANYDIDFATLLAGYESDWFMGIDRLYEHRLISPDLVELSTNRTANVRNPNAGVVGVRNSKRGNEIIDAIIDTYNEDNFQSKCVKDGKLIGMWAGVCYEQGVMIQVLFDKYRDYLTILSPDIIHNWYSCTGSFIIHLFGSSSEDRAKCFKKYTPWKLKKTISQ